MLFHRRLRPSETIAAAGRRPRRRSSDTARTPSKRACGSWAAFKLSRYLIAFTGEARYGDWAERILYNGIGAALPVTAEGKTFYYSDYRLAGGMKVYYWDALPCCSGTYIQAVADYHNIIYYKDAFQPLRELVRSLRSHLEPAGRRGQTDASKPAIRGGIDHPETGAG